MTLESKKQKLKNWEENDYYDSDEDTFLDRTGSSMYMYKYTEFKRYYSSKIYTLLKKSIHRRSFEHFSNTDVSVHFSFLKNFPKK